MSWSKAGSQVDGTIAWAGVRTALLVFTTKWTFVLFFSVASIPTATTIATPGAAKIYRLATVGIARLRNWSSRREEPD